MARSEKGQEPVVSPWAQRILTWPAYATILAIVVVVVTLVVVSLLD